MRWLIVCMMLALGLAGCAGETDEPEALDQAPVEGIEPDEQPEEAPTQVAKKTAAVEEQVVEGLDLNLTASALNGTAPLEVTFFMAATGDDLDAVNWTLTDLHDLDPVELANGTGFPAEATVVLDAGLHVVTLAAANEAGLATKILEINVTEPERLAFTIADFSAMAGILTPVPVTAVEGLSCTWSAETMETIEDECNVEMRFGSVGQFTVGVEVTDGTTTETFEVIADVEIPTSSGASSGQLFMYNAGGVGASNIVSLGTGEPPMYINGDSTSIQGRSMDGGGAEAAEYLILTAAGTVVAGPFNAGNPSNADWTSVAYTVDLELGDYLLVGAVYFAGGNVSVVKDTSDTGNDNKRFEVIA